MELWSGPSRPFRKLWHQPTDQPTGRHEAFQELHIQQQEVFRENINLRESCCNFDRIQPLPHPLFLGMKLNQSNFKQNQCNKPNLFLQQQRGYVLSIGVEYCEPYMEIFIRKKKRQGDALLQLRYSPSGRYPDYRFPTRARGGSERRTALFPHTCPCTCLDWGRPL